MLASGVLQIAVMGFALGAEAVPAPPPGTEPSPEVTPTPSASPSVVRRAAILELKATGIDEAVVVNLTDLLTAEAGKIPGYRVISQAEIRDMLGFEMQKQSLGCDEASCFAQIGGALGADLIVTGTFAKIGETFVLNVRLIDIVKSETERRVGETVAGQVDLLPPLMRLVAWRLFADEVPKEVQADFDATRARMEAQAARARGDSDAVVAAEKAKAEAEKAKAEAEKAKAEAEMTRSRAPTATPTDAARTRSTVPPPGGWQRTAKNVSIGVAVVGFLAGGTLSVLSFLKAREVGGSVKVADERTTSGGHAVYDGSQQSAQAAYDLQTFSYYGYGVGLAGVAAAIVFKILEPEAPTGTAWRAVPTVTGLAVEF